MCSRDLPKITEIVERIERTKSVSRSANESMHRCILYLGTLNSGQRIMPELSEYLEELIRLSEKALEEKEWAPVDSYLDSIFSRAIRILLYPRRSVRAS